MSETSNKARPTDVLTKAATQYAAAKAGEVVTKLGERAAGTRQTTQQDDDSQGFISGTVERLGEGASPVGAAVKSAGTTVKEGVAGLFKSKGSSKRPHNIVEDCYIGAPVDLVFAAWTQYEEFAGFMKGVQQVTRGDTEEGEEPGEGEETTWTGKIFLSTRSWKATTEDYDPPNRIAWKSEGAKGTVDGTITFTPVGDNATLVLLVMEYRSKGPIEWIGQRWQTVGRRARLDLKHFKRYVMRTEPDKLADLNGVNNHRDEQSEQPEESEQSEVDEEQSEQESRG